MRNRKRKRVIGAVLALEIITISVIFLMVILKGDISFHTIVAKETVNQQNEETAPKEDSGDQNTPNGEENQAGVDAIGDSGETSKENDKTSEDKANGKASENKDNYTVPEDELDSITISVAGDVTLGRDLKYGYERSFDHEFEIQNKDYGYFFRNVREIFEKDDITIVNLETTLTTAEKPAEKKFRFKADPSYVKILNEGDIEAVSIANNHTYDYLEQGYKDTLKTLKAAEVGYFGYEHKYLKEIRGIRVGIAGFVGWEASGTVKDKINQVIKELRSEDADIVILMFHWGIERDHYPNTIQQELAHYSIDNGADLVLGSHPHVLQGVEEYKGKNIIYSLGNFSFGGNKNPGDKDSMIYTHDFNFKNGELVSQDYEIIPCSISSVKERNNYQPTPLEGSEKERVLNKIEEYSKF